MLSASSSASGRFTTHAPAEFRDDLRLSKGILEDVLGQAVRGYRAASFSINGVTLMPLTRLSFVGGCWLTYHLRPGRDRSTRLRRIIADNLDVARSIADELSPLDR